MAIDAPKKPLCFVLMPFGEKIDAMGNAIDFDAVYRQLIRPAIEAADLEPVRADEEQAGAIIHKPMFERLVLCEYAVADLTTANANVFYELGVRHAVKPYSTVLLFSHDSRMPFDVGLLRALPYHLGNDGRPSRVDADSAALTERLGKTREAAAAREKPMVDSPLYQLLDGYPDVDHTRTDVFRDEVIYAETVKAELAALREKAKTTQDHPAALEGVRLLELWVGRLDAVETGVVVDLFLSYRALSSWEDMIRLVGLIPKPLAATILVQGQLAFALNRAGRAGEAERILLDLAEKWGPSSESFGLLGRVYKDHGREPLRRTTQPLPTPICAKPSTRIATVSRQTGAMPTSGSTSLPSWRSRVPSTLTESANPSWRYFCPLFNTPPNVRWLPASPTIGITPRCSKRPSSTVTAGG